MRSVVTTELVHFLREHFKLGWEGDHGARHWARVRHNGLLLAEKTGANTRVIELFAFLHDAERHDEWQDPLHGVRSAMLVNDLHGVLFQASNEELGLLMHACHHHSDGLLDADITVQTCWDADRLDLGRVGIKPDPAFLCTAAARDSRMIEQTYFRSIQDQRRRRRR